MKRIAIITGATGGIGKCILRELLKERLDEIWAIALRRPKLDALTEEFGNKVVPISLNLCSSADIAELSRMLKEHRPDVVWLVNNAGKGNFAPSAKFTPAEICSTVNLNCTAYALMINACAPYMDEGAKIINVASAAAFQPLPYLNLYAATKAFVRSYSRALAAEFKPRKISVTALCPGWVDTNLLPKTLNGKKVRYPALIAPEKAAAKAVKDAKKGRDMSVPSAYVKIQHLFVKIMPQRLIMKIWHGGVKKYL